MARHLFTSESVTEGHPDKICDQISDAILDEILTHDPNARVACETCASTGLVHIMGEITTNCYVDFQKVVREVVADIGYTRAKFGFDADTCAVISNIDAPVPVFWKSWYLPVFWSEKRTEKRCSFFLPTMQYPLSRCCRNNCNRRF